MIHATSRPVNRFGLDVPSSSYQRSVLRQTAGPTHYYYGSSLHHAKCYESLGGGEIKASHPCIFLAPTLGRGPRSGRSRTLHLFVLVVNLLNRKLTNLKRGKNSNSRSNTQMSQMSTTVNRPSSALTPVGS